MSIIIDQSWVRTWSDGELTSQQLSNMRMWIKATPKELHPLVKRFPPMSLVKALRPLDIPYPWTVGIVSSYHAGDRIGVKQEPLSKEAIVSACDLALVGFWKYFDDTRVSAILRRDAATR